MELRRCLICGYPLDSKNRTGLCSNRTPACREARKRLTAEEKPGKFRIDIKAGDTFGAWTALEDYDRASLTVLCRCECGTEKRIKGYMLTNDRTTACRGCGQKNRQKPPKEPYLMAGSIFSRLTLLEDALYAHGDVRCRCECGNEEEVTVMAALVKSARTRSCGCLHRERITKHGLSKHPYYTIWKDIIHRCGNPNSQGYEGYGSRGITVCARWRDDVAAFIIDIERELGPRPEGKYETSGRALYELDRTDNDGGYWCGRCPDCISKGRPMNVRWSDRPTQMQNRRKVNGLTRQLADAVARAEKAEAGRPRGAPVCRMPEPALMADPLFSESDIPQ